MKKYLLPISLIISVVLLIIIIVLAVMFFSLKDKITSTIEQVKNGQYSELINTNVADLIPEGLKNFTKVDAGESECDYFYQKITVLMTYLEANPSISSSEEYAGQLDLLKSTVEKTPLAIKKTACEKGISAINYISQKLSIESK